MPSRPDPAGFTPIRRRSVSDVVFAELRDAILTSRFAPGDLLPPERDLATSFAVNRHAVREALNRLQVAGFVRVVHGEGTRVLDIRRSAGLDLLAHIARAGDLDPMVLRDGLEMRRCIGMEAARLAATRGTRDSHARILAAASGYAENEYVDADRRFWDEVVEASGNFAFRLALNSLVQAIDGSPDSMDAVLAGDRADLLSHQPLAEAIAAGDAERALHLADAILSQAIDVWSALTATSRHTSAIQSWTASRG